MKIIFLVIPSVVFSKALTTILGQLQCSANRNFLTLIFVEYFSMAASTDKKSILTGTRSLQNRKRCLINNENAKSVKRFPQLTPLLLLFTCN